MCCYHSEHILKKTHLLYDFPKTASLSMTLLGLNAKLEVIIMFSQMGLRCLFHISLILHRFRLGVIPKTDRFVLEKERVSEKEIFSSFFSFCLNEFFFCSTGLYLVIFSRLQRKWRSHGKPNKQIQF